MKENAAMDVGDRLSASQAQLDLVLSFFSRVDAKLSVVLGIDLAMLGVLFTALAPTKHISYLIGVSIAAFLVLALISCANLYRGSFPDLNGGTASLVFFREIAKKRETEFVGAFNQLSQEALAKDLLEQVWRNAKILTMKFDRLKSAYTYMVLAMIPWAMVLAQFVYRGA